MKKIGLLTLAVSLFSLHFAVAAEPTEPTLIPANSLEEMINAGAEADPTVEHFGIGFRFDWGHHHGVRCFARNRRGERFEASGFYPREVQERAMTECYQSSRHCFELGCHSH